MVKKSVEHFFLFFFCVRGMANLVEHWFNLLYRVHADNSTDARSQDCDPFLRANNKKSNPTRSIKNSSEGSKPPLMAICHCSLQSPGGPGVPQCSKIALPLHKVQPELYGTMLRQPRSIECGVKRIVRNTGDDESVVGPQPVIQHQEVLERIDNRKMENTLQ